MVENNGIFLKKIVKINWYIMKRKKKGDIKNPPNSNNNNTIIS